MNPESLNYELAVLRTDHYEKMSFLLDALSDGDADKRELRCVEILSAARRVRAIDRLVPSSVIAR